LHIIDEVTNSRSMSMPTPKLDECVIHRVSENVPPMANLCL